MNGCSTGQWEAELCRSSKRIRACRVQKNHKFGFEVLRFGSDGAGIAGLHRAVTTSWSDDLLRFIVEQRATAARTRRTRTDDGTYWVRGEHLGTFGRWRPTDRMSQRNRIERGAKD